MSSVAQEIFALVSSAPHPTPECGGPCETCAFRPGSEASMTAHTVALATACIGALDPFHCHEKPQLCRGWIAAVNIQGVPDEDERRKWALLSSAIGIGIEAAKAAEAARGE